MCREGEREERGRGGERGEREERGRGGERGEGERGRERRGGEESIEIRNARGIYTAVL